MKAHTKGPWTRFLDGGKTLAIMPAGRPGDVAEFKTPPTEADALLMAAAPDLLSILEDGLAGGADGMHGARCRCLWHEAARAAVAKAKGRP